jgi:sortase (surface protein transpeptidase)
VGRLSISLRSRLLPAILTATGVSLIAGGLLSYTGAAGLDAPSASPTIITVAPTPTFTLPTFPPESGSPPPSASPTAAVDRVATRVVVPALRIDLPVVKPAGGADAYPQCNVAMYIQQLHQPGQGGATYLYAHARPGMFGPIYHLAIEKGKPNSMKGMLVEVYTSDDLLFSYQVVDVRLDQRNLNDAQNATEEEMWLQTSEGPKGTPGKTQLKAIPIGLPLPADHAAANPVAKPVNCK